MADGTTEIDTQPQNASQAPEKAPEKLLQSASNTTKSFLSGDNLFGSGAIIAYLYPQLKTISGGRARRDVGGRASSDIWRMRSSALDIFSNAGLFFSGRGAEAPEGDSMFARMKYALMHPNKSSVYFYRLMQIPVQVTSIIANVEKGMDAMKEGGRKSERIRLASAGITTAGGALYLIGMFGSNKKHQKQGIQLPDKDDKNSIPANEASLHPLYVIKSAFKKYPVMMAAALCDILVDLSLISEAVMVNREATTHNKKSGGELARAGAAAVALDTGINYYTWVQMVKESRNTSPTIQPLAR